MTGSVTVALVSSDAEPRRGGRVGIHRLGRGQAELVYRVGGEFDRYRSYTPRELQVNGLGGPRIHKDIGGQYPDPGTSAFAPTGIRQVRVVRQEICAVGDICRENCYIDGSDGQYPS